jgi:transmembrane sensor
LGGAVGMGGFLYYQAHFHRDLLSVFRDNHMPVRELAADASMEQTFHLPDGSLVRLGKSSHLYFMSEWGPDKSRREVFLEGVATFEIRKNPAVPFYVYTGQLVTRALRATIVVNAFVGDVQTVVTDKTGSVSVYRQVDFAEHAGGRNEVAGIVLGPNQEAVYDRKEDRIRKTLAERPEPLEERPDTMLIYKRTPIRQVFSQLYELYGIPIQFDGEVLDSCLLTANMGRQSFYERLDHICKAIGGAYEVVDGSVVVTAVGCR